MAPKRPFPQEEGESSQPLAKRPRCCEEVFFHMEAMEAMVRGHMETMEAMVRGHMEAMEAMVRGHMEAMEGMVRGVVPEQLQKASLKFVNPTPRSSMNQILGASRYRLDFLNRMPLLLFTNRRIKSEDQVPLQLALKDTISNEIVTSDPWGSLSVKIVALNGDFKCNENIVWSKEEFDMHVESARDGKRPLLKGELNVRMSKGVGVICDVSFTDNSSWTRSGKFRLGAVVSDSRYNGERVQEAITEAVQVKDERGETNQKDSPPSLTDKVNCLKGIMKDGKFHKRLMDAGVNNVRDFLSLYVVDREKLLAIRGPSRSKKAWEETVNHAFQCSLGDKLYSYPIVNEGIVLVFNSIFQIRKVKVDGFDRLENELPPYLKERLDDYKKRAYANQEERQEHHDTPEQTLGLDSFPGPSSCNLNVPNFPHQTTFHDASTSQVHTMNQVNKPYNVPQPGVYHPPQYDTTQKMGCFTNSSDRCTGLLFTETNSSQARTSAMPHPAEAAQYVGSQLVSTIRNDEIPFKDSAFFSTTMSTDPGDNQQNQQLQYTSIGVGLTRFEEMENFLLSDPGTQIPAGCETTLPLPTRTWSPLRSIVIEDGFLSVEEMESLLSDRGVQIPGGETTPLPTCLLLRITVKLTMEDSKKRAIALKTAVALCGVVSVQLEGDKVVVVGDGVDSVKLPIKLRKKMCYAELVEIKEERSCIMQTNKIRTILKGSLIV